LELDGAPDVVQTPLLSSNGSAFTAPANAGTESGTKNAQGIVIKEAGGGWTLSWCKDAYWGQVLAASCGNDGLVKVVQVCTLEQQNHALVTLDPYTLPSVSTSASIPTSSSSAPAPSIPGLTTPTQAPSQDPAGPSMKRYSISALSWAPTCGRSYHTLATGSRDGRVRIWRMRAPTVVNSGRNVNAPNNTPTIGVTEAGSGLSGGGGKERWSASLVADFREHEYAVSKVDWNVTGTTLTSSGADGHVRLWKMSMGGVWRPMVSVNAMERELGGNGKAKERVDVEMD